MNVPVADYFSPSDDIYVTCQPSKLISEANFQNVTVYRLFDTDFFLDFTLYEKKQESLFMP